MQIEYGGCPWILFIKKERNFFPESIHMYPGTSISIIAVSHMSMKMFAKNNMK